ncbi:unnamed protein product, partial [Meganyctiphanes norvegica]
MDIMASNVEKIATLTPSHKNWNFDFNINAVVVRKSSVRSYRNRKTGKLIRKYFTVRLKDKSGEIEAVFYNEHVNKYYKIMHMHHKYNIKNGHIKENRKRYRYKLFVTHYTEIESLTIGIEHYFKIKKP